VPLPWQGRWPVARYYDNGLPTGGSLEVFGQYQQAATLASYVPGTGWAPPGTAYLLVPPPAVTCTGAACLEVTATLDDPKVFAFKAADGTPGTTMPGHHSIGLSVSTVSFTGTADDAVVFRVPATVTTGTVTLNWSAAPITEDDGSGHSTPTSWLTAPGTAATTTLT
jgi:hypothetical protein